MRYISHLRAGILHGALIYLLSACAVHRQSQSAMLELPTRVGVAKLDVASSSPEASEEELKEVAARVLRCNSPSMPAAGTPVVVNVFISRSSYINRFRHLMVFELRRGGLKLAHVWRIVRLSSLDNTEVLEDVIHNMAAESWQKANLPIDKACDLRVQAQ